MCGLVWRATGASLCVWNQQDMIRAKKFGHRVTTRAVQQTPLFVANSEAARGFLVSELGAPHDRVGVVLEGVEPRDLARFRDTWRVRLGVDARAPIVSMLAHLHPGKDHATLLRAWRIVLDECVREAPVLLLAGRPSGTEHAVKALAFDLEFGRSVRFLDDVEDVDGILAASDVAVLSSRSESRPHALLESAAAGLPLVATDVPGIRETVGAHQTPYLAPPDDPARLAEVLVELISQPALRTELGRENRRNARESASDPGPATVELISRALAR